MDLYDAPRGYTLAMMVIKREMALFGMVWLLRVRAEMRRCAKCRREAAQREDAAVAPRRQRSVEQQTDASFSGCIVQSRSADDILSPATTTTSFYCPEPGSGGGNTSYYCPDSGAAAANSNYYCPETHGARGYASARQSPARTNTNYYSLEPPRPGGTYCEVHGYIPPKEGKYLTRFTGLPQYVMYIHYASKHNVCTLLHTSTDYKCLLEHLCMWNR